MATRGGGASRGWRATTGYGQLSQRFQKEVEVCYDPKEQLDVGLIQHYHHLTEQHYRAILLRGLELSELSHKKVNPFPRRERQFEVNRQNRGRIDFSGFIARREGLV